MQLAYDASLCPVVLMDTERLQRVGSIKVQVLCHGGGERVLRQGAIGE